MYDISDTDPADILGDDVVDVYDDEQVPLLFIEPVIVYTTGLFSRSRA